MILQERLARVKLLVVDHDGVLTDNKVYVNVKGEEMCRYSRADGIGIERLKKLGVRCVVLTSEPKGIVDVRCEKIGIGVLHANEKSKREWLWEMADGLTARPEKDNYAFIAYIGNDMNDLECLKAAGVPFIVKDAAPALGMALLKMPWGAEVEGHSILLDAIITKRKGGDGAVREVCDMIADAIEAQGRGTIRLEQF